MKRLALIACMTVGLMSVRAADEKPKADAPPVDEKAMMEAFIKLSQPNENHKRLEALAGEFKAAVKMWMGPGEPQASEGTSSSAFIMNGRWLKDDFTGMMMGKPFKGMSLTGYDNVKKKYINLWIDEMSSGAMIAEGEVDATGKIITFVSEYPDPMTGKKSKSRTVTTLIDKDHHRFEMYETPEGAKEVKIMQIEYTRTK